MKTINYVIFILLFIIVSVLIYTFVLKGDNNDDNKIEKLIVNNNSITIDVDETRKIDAYIENNDSAILSFQSVDESVATVSNDGTVTGVNVGKTAIIISYISKDGNLTGKCDILVTDTQGKKKIESISFPKDNLIIGVGNSYTIDYTLVPNNTPSSISFTSSDESIVSIDKDGLITGVSEGNATIRVTVNESIYKNLNVYVRNNVPTSYVNVPTDIKVAKSNITLKIGEEYVLDFDVTPSDANKEVVKITSDNEDVVKYENYKIRALKEGIAVISLESVNKVVTYINVTVKNTNVNVSVKNIKVTSNNILTLNVNETSQISYSITPSDATNKKVIFESLSPNVATVSQTGLITAVSKGDAYISLKTNDGGYEVFVKVTVNSSSSTDNNSSNNGSSGVNKACNSTDPQDTEFNRCFVASRQLTVDKTSVSIPAGGTAYVQVSIPSTCGTLVKWTRKTADGQQSPHWSNYVSQSRSNETSTGFTWIITAKSSAKGKTVLVSQTVQYDSLSPSGKCTGNVKSMRTITVNIT